MTKDWLFWTAVAISVLTVVAVSSNVDAHPIDAIIAVLANLVFMIGPVWVVRSIVRKLRRPKATEASLLP